MSVQLTHYLTTFYKLPNIYAALEKFLAAQHVISSAMSSLDYEPPTETLSTYCQKNMIGILEQY